MAVFDPLDWLTLAQLLIQATDEASHRTAIGRAHYACHLIARDQLFGIDARKLKRTDRKNLAGSKVASEQRVVSAAILSTPGLGRGVAKVLADRFDDLKGMREQADYYRDAANPDTGAIFRKYDVQGWNDLAQRSLTLANRIVPELQKLPSYERGQWKS